MPCSCDQPGAGEWHRLIPEGPDDLPMAAKLRRSDGSGLDEADGGTLQAHIA